MYYIENNVEFPGTKSSGRKLKYPWDRLKLGASSFLPNKAPYQVASQCYTYGVRWGKKFSARKAVKHGRNGTRVWRIA
jgi:hypothetical protein